MAQLAMKNTTRLFPGFHTNTPNNLKLRLFDPKQVELSAYSDSLCLAYPVVLDKKIAVVRLQDY